MPTPHWTTKQSNQRSSPEEWAPVSPAISLVSSSTRRPLDQSQWRDFFRRPHGPRPPRPVRSGSRKRPSGVAGGRIANLREQLRAEHRSSRTGGRIGGKGTGRRGTWTMPLYPMPDAFPSSRMPRHDSSPPTFTRIDLCRWSAQGPAPFPHILGGSALSRTTFFSGGHSSTFGSRGSRNPAVPKFDMGLLMAATGVALLGDERPDEAMALLTRGPWGVQRTISRRQAKPLAKKEGVAREAEDAGRPETAVEVASPSPRRARPTKRAWRRSI